MQIEKNCLGGLTVVLTESDRLDAIPSTHAHMLTSELAAAFKNPVARLRVVADRCPFPAMKRWLLELSAKPQWTLNLSVGHSDYGGSTLAGFRWSSESVQGATIALPAPASVRLPRTLQQYFTLVDKVNFCSFGASGHINGKNSLQSLPDFLRDIAGTEGMGEVYFWGADIGGNQLVFTHDDRAGWYDHDENSIEWRGTIADVLEEVYAEALAGRVPDMSPPRG